MLNKDFRGNKGDQEKIMTGQGIVFAAITVAMVLAPTPGSSQTECEADHECRQTEFCYRNRYCSRCLDCAIYKREASSLTTCAKTALECGACVKGYREEILSGTDIRGLCILGVVMTTGTTADITSSLPPTVTVASSVGNITTAPIVSGALGILLGIAILSLCVWVYKKLKESRPRSRDPESPLDHGEESPSIPPPPPYNCCVAPLLATAPQPAEYPHGPDPGFIYGHIEELKENPLQQAIPFVKPQAPYAISEEELEETDDAESIGHHSPTPPDLADDDTMPSSWVPENANQSVADDDDSAYPQDDSGISLPCSEAHSTISLSDPTDATTRGSITIHSFFRRRSFAGRLVQTNDSQAASATSHCRYESDESTVPAKRSRRDSGSLSIGLGDEVPENATGNGPNDAGQPLVVTNITNHVCVNIMQRNTTGI